MTRSDYQYPLEPTPEGWFAASSMMTRIAASSSGIGATFSSAVSILKKFGPMSVVMLVNQEGTTSQVYSEGFSDQLVDAFRERLRLGHLLFEPRMSSIDEVAEDFLAELMAQEGIGQYCAWPLISREKRVGELYVGISVLSDPALLPPPIFMDTFSSTLALAVDRHWLIVDQNKDLDTYQWNERLLNSLIHGTRDSVIVTDSLGRVMLMNPAAEIILGVTERETSGKRLNDVDDRLSPLGRSEEAYKLSEGRITIFPGKNGRPKVIATRISAFNHGGREYTAWHLREERRGYLDATGNESRFSAFVNNDRLAAFHCDHEGIIASRNSTLLKLLGADSNDIVEGARIDTCRQLVTSGIVSKVNQCLQSGEAVVSSHEIDHPSRGSTHLTAHFAPIVLSNGELVGVQAIIEDTTEYVRTRTSLMQSEERYRVFFKNAPISLLEVDLSETFEQLLQSDVEMARAPYSSEAIRSKNDTIPLKVTAANPAAIAMYGAASKETLVQVWADRFNGVKRDALRNMLQAFLDGESTYRFDAVHRTVLCKCIHVTISAAIAPGHEIDFSRVLLSIADITELKVMEAALKSQLVLERLVSTISARFVSMPPEETREGIATVVTEAGAALDVDCVIVFELLDGRLSTSHRWIRDGYLETAEKLCAMGDEWVNYFESRPGEWETININAADQLSEDSIERHFVDEAGLSSLLMVPLIVQESSKGLMVFASKSKPRQWLEESVSLLRILSDVLAGALDRQQRELMRRQSEALLKTVFQSMAGGLVVVDTLGKILLVNPSAAKSFHLETPSDYIGLPIGDVARGAEEMMRNSAPGEQQQIVLTLNDGTKRTFGFSSASATSGQRIIVFRDLTKMLEADTRQKRAEELARLGMVVAKLSHEIKNPLASILLGLRALEDNGALGAEDSYILSSLLDEVRFLKIFVEDFLGATRFQEAMLVMGQVEPIFRSVYDAQNRVATRGGISLVLDLTEPDAAAAIDEHAMNRAITNLVKNAIEACDVGQSVHFGFRTLDRADRERRFPGYAGEILCLYVEDTGPGMPESVMENLFIPFTTTKTRGNGLGLSMVRETVTGHGGIIEVITPTREDGGGTRFEILIAKGERPCCLDVHSGCLETCAICPMPEGCPVREKDGFFTCWIVKGKASLQETGRWNLECASCPVYLAGNLEHFYIRRSLRKERF